MASNYGWIITVDRTEGKKEIVQIVGPSGVSDDMTLELVNGAGMEFRMYDDDAELCYEGRWLGSVGSACMFGPLDDFGEPNAGCTEIWYRGAEGEFEQL